MRFAIRAIGYDRHYTTLGVFSDWRDAARSFATLPLATVRKHDILVLVVLRGDGRTVGLDLYQTRPYVGYIYGLWAW